MSDESPDTAPPEEGEASAPSEEAASEPTFWLGKPCAARRVSVVVADDPRFAAYWAHDLLGERRNAVEVSQDGLTFYLDDEPFVGRAEPAWEKVTVGRGMNDHGHRELAVEPGSVEERTAEAEPEPEPERESEAALPAGEADD